MLHNIVSSALLGVLLTCFFSSPVMAGDKFQYRKSLYNSGLKTVGFVKPIVLDNDIIAVLDANGNYGFYNTKKEKVETLLNLNDNTRFTSAGTLNINNYIVVTIDYVVSLINKETYELVWQKELISPIRGEPVAYDDNNFIVLTANGEITKININGDIKWQNFGISDESKKFNNTSPAVLKDSVITPDNIGRIAKIDGNSGQVLWENSTDCKILQYPSTNVKLDPVVTDNSVFIATECHSLKALDINTGGLLWEKKYDIDQLAYLKNAGLVAVTHDNLLISIDSVNGDINWSTAIEINKNSIFSTLIEFNNTIWLSINSGKILEVSKLNGEILKVINVPAGIVHPFVISNNALYAVTDNGKILIIEKL